MVKEGHLLGSSHISFKELKTKGSDVISASEIGNYTYCSISWGFYRSGYGQRDNPKMVEGRRNHANLGRIIARVQARQQMARRLTYLGALLITISLAVLALRLI